MEPVTEANIDVAPDTQDAVDNPPKRRRRKRIDKWTLALSFVIAIGLVLIGRGLAVSLTGDDRAKLPEEIESVEPYPEAVQVLSQSRVFIDLIPGYTGVLIVDGVELPTINIDDVGEQFEADPGQQIDLPATTIFEPGNYTLTFVPSDDALVDKFETGPHQARVIYWKITEGRQFARSCGERSTKRT